MITDHFFITDAHEDDIFPNEDFFLDIDNLFNDMSLGGDNTNNSSFSLCLIFRQPVRSVLSRDT
jgi:hypothetical protein